MGTPTSQAQDLVLVGGTVLACERDGETTDALAIRDGRILATGTAEEMRAVAGRGARTVDVGGATVLPGLIDTHPHLMHFGALAEPLVDLADAVDHADIVRRIAAKARETPAGEWVMATPVGEAHYFIRRSWRDLHEGELPTREVLDRASDEHPVLIQAWAPTTPNVLALNSLGLARLGLDEHSGDTLGNVRIEKDASGSPTGRLYGSVNNYYSDEPHIDRLLRDLPLLQPEAVPAGTVRAMHAYNAMGVTCAYEGHALDFELIAAYKRLREAGLLSLRVLCCPEAEPYGAPWMDPPDDAAFLERLERAQRSVRRDDDLLRIDGVTISRGGSCGPGTMLMREPYRGPYGELTEGRSIVTKERLRTAARFAFERGLRLNIVTTGTRATDDHLEVLEEVAHGGPLTAGERPWLVQHLTFALPEHVQRIAALGLDVTTSMSFCWGKGELVRERMGDALLEHLIPLQRLLDAHLHVGCGSDWGPKNIFEHIALAVEPSYAGSNARAATPGVTRAQALAMWTREAARVLCWNDIGTLAPGNHADLCLVDRNPLECALDELPATDVRVTLLGGVPVHGELE